jgi:hypothetical protein
MAETVIPLANGKNLAAHSEAVGTVTAMVPRNRVAPDPVDADGVLVATLLAAAAADFSVDGSGTAVAYAYTCPASSQAVIDELVIALRDASPTAATLGGIAAVAVGCSLAVYSTTPAVLVDLLAGQTIKRNGDMAALGAELEIDAAGGLVVARWRFTRPIRLAAGESIRLTVADDLTGIDDARATIRGLIVSV